MREGGGEWGSKEPGKQAGARQTAEGGPRCRRVAAAAAAVAAVTCRQLQFAWVFSARDFCIVAAGGKWRARLHTHTHTPPHPNPSLLLSSSPLHAPCIFLRSPQVAYFRFLHALLAPHWAGSVSTYAPHARESLSLSLSLAVWHATKSGTKPK